MTGAPLGGTSHRQAPADPDLPEIHSPFRPLLTSSERECIQWAATGLNYEAIAARLSISRRTVVARVTSTQKKYGASNVTGLCVKALKAGEIELR